MLSGYTQKCLIFMPVKTLWINFILPPVIFVNLTEMFDTSVTANPKNVYNTSLPVAFLFP